MADNIDPRTVLRSRIKEEIRAEALEEMVLPIERKCPLSAIERCTFGISYPVALCSNCFTLGMFLDIIRAEEIEDKRLTLEQDACSRFEDESETFVRKVLEKRKEALLKDTTIEELEGDDLELLNGLVAIILEFNTGVRAISEATSKAFSEVFEDE